MREIFFYCLIGVINTCIGFGIIFVLVFLGVFAELANFLGYCVGTICSFFLNNRITFAQVRIDKKRGLSKFFLSMGVAYLINLIVLSVSYRFFGINIYFSQIFAGISYTLCGFLMSKFFVWKK